MRGAVWAAFNKRGHNSLFDGRSFGGGQAVAYKAKTAPEVQPSRGIVVRLRVGDWRVVMRDEDVLRVLHVTSRGSAYRERRR